MDTNLFPSEYMYAILHVLLKLDSGEMKEDAFKGARIK